MSSLAASPVSSPPPANSPSIFSSSQVTHPTQAERVLTPLPSSHPSNTCPSIFKDYNPELFPMNLQFTKYTRSDGQTGLIFPFSDYQFLRYSTMSTRNSIYPTIPIYCPILPFGCIGPIGDPISTPLRIDFLHSCMSSIIDTTKTIGVNRRITETDKRSLITSMHDILRMSLYLSQQNIVWLARLVTNATAILKDINPEKVIDQKTWMPLARCFYPIDVSVRTSEQTLRELQLQFYELNNAQKTAVSADMGDLSSSDLDTIQSGDVYSKKAPIMASTVTLEDTQQPTLTVSIKNSDRYKSLHQPESIYTYESTYLDDI